MLWWIASDKNYCPSPPSQGGEMSIRNEIIHILFTSTLMQGIIRKLFWNWIDQYLLPRHSTLALLIITLIIPFKWLAASYKIHFYLNFQVSIEFQNNSVVYLNKWSRWQGSFRLNCKIHFCFSTFFGCQARFNLYIGEKCLKKIPTLTREHVNY